MKIKSIATVALLVGLGGMTQAQDTDKAEKETSAKKTYEMKLKFEKDKPLAHMASGTVEVEQDLGFMQNEVTVTTKQGRSIEWVETTKDGHFKTKWTYDTVGMHLKSGETEMKYDSETDKEPAQGMKGVAEVNGKSAHVTIEPNGKVTEVTDGDEAFEAIVKSVGAEEADMAEGLIKNDALKNSIYEGQCMLPSKAVAVGDTWEVKFDRSASRAGTITYTLTCKLDKVDADVAEVTFKGTGKLKESDDEGEEPQMTIDMKTADMSGTLKFDLKLGQIVHETQKVDLEMEVTTPQGMTVNQKMESNMTITCGLKKAKKKPAGDEPDETEKAPKEE